MNTSTSICLLLTLCFCQLSAQRNCEDVFQVSPNIHYEMNNEEETNTFTTYGCPDDTQTTNFNARDILVNIVKKNTNDRLTVNIRNTQGFDLFLLDNCDPNSPVCLQGRNVNNEVHSNWLIEPKGEPWAAGTYGISIDAVTANNIGDIGLMATCGRLNCSAAQTIDCNTIISGNTATGENNISAYRHDEEYKAMNTGNELLYRFTIQEAQAVDISLDILGNKDLELFLMSSCDEYDVLFKSTKSSGIDERIQETLPAGTYYILVEGFNQSEGAFTLSVNADCAASTDCESPFYNGKASSLQCEKFEDYQLGMLSNDTPNWITWTSEHRNHEVTDVRSSCTSQQNIITEGRKSLKVASFFENGEMVNPDVVYQLDNRLINQTHQLSWNMYVPSGKEAYFNIQKNQERDFKGGGEFEVYFDKNKKLRLGTDSEGIYDYPQDRWFSLVVTFEPINDEIQATVVVDGIPVIRTKYGDLNTLLGGVNFYATDDAEYYVDCICLNRLECNITVFCAPCASSCINGIDFTCIACNDYGIDYNKVKFEDCPTYESTNGIEVSCGELRPKEYLDGQNRLENYYACFEANTDLKAKEKIYTFELTQTSDITINAIPSGPNPNLELFLFSECLDFCVAQGELTFLEDNFESYHAMQIAQSGLQPGIYYVVVDDRDSDRFTQAEDTYSISFNWDCGDLPRVCDLGGQFVNFGNKVEGTFGKTDQRLLNLRGADCISNDLGGGIPEDYVFDVFVFYNDGDEGDTKLGISDLDDNLIETDRPLITHVFECDCRDLQVPNLAIVANEEDCYQNCIDNDGNGSKNATVLEPKEGTFYYFIVAGPEGTDYKFDFVPNSLCERTGLGQTRLYGDTTLIGEEIPGGLGDFSTTGEQNIYTNCTSSSNQYLGNEKLYELAIDRPVYVNITATVSTAMGMFLYNNDCGRDCKNTAELPSSSEGGLLSIADSLIPGTYYLMIDSENPEGGTFDLTINTNVKEEIFSITQDFCPKNEDQVHTVFIEGLNNTIIADNTYVIFHVDLGNDNHVPIINEPSPLQWDANTGELTVELYHDLADNLTCSYIENDTFLIKLKPEDANGTQTNSIIVRGVYIDDPDDFGETDTFKIGGSSGISDFILTTETETLKLQHNGECKNYNSSGFQVVVSSNLDWYVDIPGGEPWFSVDPKTDSNDGLLNVTFNSFNNSSETRTATFFVKSTTGIVREVSVCQKSSCSNFLAAAGLDQTLECTKSGVELTANATGFPFLNTFNWRAISGTIQPNSFIELDVESSIFVTEAGEYEVTVNNNFGCSFKDTIKVSQNLPMINSETITDNSMQGVADGSIAVNIIGGTAPYTYTWNGQNGSSTINNIPEGHYELEITDNKGCTLNRTYIIEAMQEASTEEEEDPDSEGSSTCSAESASNLTFNGITETNAYIYTSQPHGTVQNQFRYRVNTNTTWIETDINNTHYRSISSLASGTIYEFQVRHNCGNEDWSAYSDSATFTTAGTITGNNSDDNEGNNDDAGENDGDSGDSSSNGSSTCPVESASALYTSSITETNAYLYSSQPHGAVPNQFRYRPVGNTSWLDTDIATTYYRLLSNLNAETTYEFQVRHNCGNEDWSAYSDSATFTTNNSFTQIPIQFKNFHIDVQVKLYPNPAKKELNFISSIPFKAQQQITITNIWGQTLQTILLGSGERHQLIDISNLTSGIYLLRWDTGQAIQIFKFIKD